MPAGGPVPGFWFVGSQIFNLVLLFLCRRAKPLWILTGVSVCVCLLCAYSGVRGPWEHYFMFYDHTYAFCLGALFVRYKDRVLTRLQNNFLLLILFMLFFACSFWYPIRVLCRAACVMLMLIPAYACLQLVPESITRFLRTASILYYPMQFILIRNIVRICPEWNSVEVFICCFSIATLVSIVIYYLEKSPAFQWLRWSH